MYRSTKIEGNLHEETIGRGSCGSRQCRVCLVGCAPAATSRVAMAGHSSSISLSRRLGPRSHGSSAPSGASLSIACSIMLTIRTYSAITAGTIWSSASSGRPRMQESSPLARWRSCTKVSECRRICATRRVCGCSVPHATCYMTSRRMCAPHRPSSLFVVDAAGAERLGQPPLALVRTACMLCMYKCVAWCDALADWRSDLLQAGRIRSPMVKHLLMDPQQAAPVYHGDSGPRAGRVGMLFKADAERRRVHALSKAPFISSSLRLARAPTHWHGKRPNPGRGALAAN